MASDESFVNYICDQIRGAGEITSRKMFGEYAIYSGNKVVALVCDNQLFVKPTPGGNAIAQDLPLQPPYPGAKPNYLATERLEDRDWLTKLIESTARELPEPKPKKAGKRAQRE